MSLVATETRKTPSKKHWGCQKKKVTSSAAESESVGGRVRVEREQNNNDDNRQEHRFGLVYI